MDASGDGLRIFVVFCKRPISRERTGTLTQKVAPYREAFPVGRYEKEDTMKING